MSSIMEALKASPARGDQSCKLGAALAAIPEDTPDRGELLSAVADPAGYPAHTMSAVFTALGYPMGPAVVRDHRASRCVCYR